jgi:hypothetical protein
MIFPSRKNVGGQSPMKIASLSARALSRQSSTDAERPQSEIAAAIEPKPRPMRPLLDGAQAETLCEFRMLP